MKRIKVSHLDPQWFHGMWTALMDGQTVREINNIIFRPVDHEHGRGDLRNLLDTAETKYH